MKTPSVLTIVLVLPMLAAAFLVRPVRQQRMRLSMSSFPSSSCALASRRAALSGKVTAAAASFFLLSNPTPALAGVKPSTAEESIKAAREIKAGLKSLAEMQVAASKADWETVKTLLSRPEFKNFDSTATTLVRSDLLTAEDKTSLGTIRRFGLTADYIIMIGGLETELRVGGVLPPLKDAIEDLEDEEGNGKSVNRGEAVKFVKLARGSLQEIDRISSSVLPEGEQ
ncbi:Hypothetical protein NocV09_09400100 [Nannochloropsis oceanica]